MSVCDYHQTRGRCALCENGDPSDFAIPGLRYCPQCERLAVLAGHATCRDCRTPGWRK